MSAAGRVVLVGAGPGHPGLLTLEGARVLREADVVLYDELVSPELLALAPETADRINVGKRGHEGATRSQSEIETLLVTLARRGLHVVRLKGGDPFVFGRGGEEVSACRAAGVPCEVVPGVSAALAAPAFAGIPLTDRRYSASFAVVTGHKDPTRVSEETRWAELGRAVDTLVILMGVRNLATLVERLVAGGRDPATPSAAIMLGTRASQRVVVSPLAELPAAVERAGLGAPATVVIGDVVKLREELCWWETRPLFGWRVLVTRAERDAAEWAMALAEAGAEPVCVPAIEIGAPEPAAARALEAALRDLSRFDWVAFASRNGVRAFIGAARSAGVALPAPGVRFACVGPQTARALLDAGLPVHCAAGGDAGGGAEALADLLAEAGPLRGRRILLPRSQLGRETLAERLRARGADVEALTAYCTRTPDLDGEDLSRRLVTRELDAVTFASPSAVRQLWEALSPAGREGLSDCVVAAVGETTAAALRERGVEPDVIPARPGGAQLVEALAAHARARRSR